MEYLFLNLLFNSALASTQPGEIPILPPDIFSWAIGIGLLLALGSIIYAGIIYIISAGNQSHQKESIDRIKGAVFGLILLISSWLILYTLNPEILRTGAIKIPKIPEVPIQGQETPPSQNVSTPQGTESPRIIGEMASWVGKLFDFRDGVENIFSRNTTARITHVDTGLTFNVQRTGGRNHADVEPLTTKDTQTLKKIYGGEFSWRREAITVTVGNRTFAASMNGMPHGYERIYDNNFDGHFCIHFYGSRTHTALIGVIDSAHQAMVRRAAGKRE